MIVDVVIPAYNEEQSVGLVVKDILGQRVRNVVVVNNNSRDQTAQVAANAGAIVLNQSIQGYGAACLMGIEHINGLNIPPDVVLFMDADHSDFAEEIPQVLKPILDGNFDLVIGSRALGNREKGSMTMPQIFGNWLATTLIRLIYRYRFTDLGPFRAILRTKLNELGMVDQNYGWTVEMQIKALKKKLRCTEVPVNYRQRIGVSKVSGTVKGTILAGHKILTTIFKYSL
ncbi:MAG: glycosyltransferase family 2 protein [Flavobacteriales bacterium]|nr:glycosyltransferase family 2 protein [Flavobacteriales bacterium]